MEILLATGNAHKKVELKRILAPHRILIPKDIGVAFDIEETGVTYLDNALLKARALSEAAPGFVIVADDSGLSVPALGGEPGVKSARYGSIEGAPNLDAPDRNALLLRNMEHLSGDQRKAFFVCCMVLLVEDYRVFSTQETFAGLIAREAAGSGGFGYDPIFHLPTHGRTVSEIGDLEKDRISHRGRAGRRLKAILDDVELHP